MYWRTTAKKTSKFLLLVVSIQKFSLTTTVRGKVNSQRVWQCLPQAQLSNSCSLTQWYTATLFCPTPPPNSLIIVWKLSRNYKLVEKLNISLLLYLISHWNWPQATSISSTDAGEKAGNPPFCVSKATTNLTRLAVNDRNAIDDLRFSQ